jgi:hypothetical protein
MANVTYDWAASDKSVTFYFDERGSLVTDKREVCPLRQYASPCVAKYDINTDTLSGCDCPRCTARDEGHTFRDCPICTELPTTQPGPA